jgi:replicative DNA helicase
MQTNNELSLKPISTFTPKWKDSLAKRLHGEETEDLIPTGFPSLDREIGGLGQSELTIIAGRPSMGKSAFVQCLTLQVARQLEDGECICYFSLEMSEAQILNNFVSQLTGIPLKVLRSPQTEELTEKKMQHPAGEEPISSGTSKKNSPLKQIIRKLKGDNAPAVTPTMDHVPED